MPLTNNTNQAVKTKHNICSQHIEVKQSQHKIQHTVGERYRPSSMHKTQHTNFIENAKYWSQLSLWVMPGLFSPTVKKTSPLHANSARTSTTALRHVEIINTIEKKRRPPVVLSLVH